MTLLIDCCLRDSDSATKKLYSAYLKELNKDEIKILELGNEELNPVKAPELAIRDENVNSNNFNHDLFRFAREFKEADRIIIAAPYWDLSFPSLLKVFIENIMIPGITFNYVDGIPVGNCNADKVIYFTTAGGFINENNTGERISGTNF